MFEPFKYGLPGAFWLTLGYALQIHFDLDQHTLLRWIVFGVTFSGIIFFVYKRRLGNGATFKNYWFAGFSSISLGCILFGAFVYLFANVFRSNYELTVSERWVVAYVEFVSQSFFALIGLTAVAGVFNWINMKK
ncbi:MAG: hypothetical protein Salg2KO_06760 [Salibacteraceae bacterium]